MERPALQRLLAILSALKAIEDRSAQLESHSEIATNISVAIERVDLSKDGIQLTLDLAPLISHQVVPAGARLSVTRFVLQQIKRRGVELRLVLKGEATAVQRTDPALLKAISRGHRWFAELASGRAPSTIELPKREGLNRQLCSPSGVAFLSPTIIEAVCAGWQPADLTAQELTRGADVPLSWRDQQRAIGIE